jgi:uncharacterized protein (TIGR02145 family)
MRILSCILALALTTTLGAQATMNLHLNDGSVLQYFMENVDSVAYRFDPPPPAMLVYENPGGLVEIVLSEIDSVTYGLDGLPGGPLVVTHTPTNITSHSAEVSGSYLMLDGTGGPKTVFWSPEPMPDPTYGHQVFLNENLTEFTATLKDLIPNRTYYAAVWGGAQYPIYTLGNQVQFTTLPGLCEVGGGVTDIDGHTYETVIYGNGQEWMIENLRTTRFADGTTIADFTDGQEWTNAEEPAWCYQNNVPLSDSLSGFGKLYNGYVISDGSVCPSGWHVPSDEEWKELESYLGMPQSELNLLDYPRGSYQNIGGMMKSNYGWQYSGTTTCESAFRIRAAGKRTHTWGAFLQVYKEAWIWTSTTQAQNTFYVRSFKDIQSGNYRNIENKRAGLSIRCVKDQ